MVRVATWSFEAGAATNRAALKAAAAELSQLHPEVILLDGVRDWQMCDTLAHALKPADYRVLVCSAFRAPGSDAPAPAQVAILSRHKAYFSWSEAWRVEGPAGGFAFAAVQLGNKRVGFFSTRTGQGAALSATNAAALKQQWAQTVNTFGSWVDNRLEAVVVGTGEAGTASGEARLTTQLLAGPLARPEVATGPEWQAQRPAAAKPVALAADAQKPPAVILNGAHAAYALDLDAPRPKVAQVSKPAVSPTSKSAGAPDVRQAGKPAIQQVWKPALH